MQLNQTNIHKDKLITSNKNQKSQTRINSSFTHENDEILKIGVASKLLGISKASLRRWGKAGIIEEVFRTAGNQRIYLLRDINTLKEVILLNCPERPTRLLEIYQSNSVALVSKNEDPTLTIGSTLELNALKTQLKGVNILLTKFQEKKVILLVLNWLISWLIVLSQKLDEHNDFLQLCYKLKSESVKLGPVEMEVSNPEIKEVYKEKKVSSVWARARKNAGSVFLKLMYKVQDNRLNSQEKDRGEKIQDDILSIYSTLTQNIQKYEKGNLNHDVCDLLLNYIPEDFGLKIPRWSVRSLSQVCKKELETKSASKSNVHRFLKEINWFTKSKVKLISPDPEYGEKMKMIASTIAKMQSDDALFYGDEFKYASNKINRINKIKYSIPGLNITPFRTTTYYAPIHSIQITGLYNPVNQKLYTEILDNLSYEKFLKGLTSMLNKIIPEVKGQIILVLDNAAYHSEIRLKDKLEERFGDKINLLFLPTYSPNLNPIERVWLSLLSINSRFIDDKIQLMENYKQSIEIFSKKEKSIKPINIHCEICDLKWKVHPSDQERKDTLNEIETHFCFNIEGLNPYIIEVLKRSEENLIMGHLR